MAVVCLMIQNLISLHVPELNITRESNQLIVNGKPVNAELVPKLFLKLGNFVCCVDDYSPVR